uniref:Uncharacterized protein n=1 Tax=Glossina pallidipes TaxID=7398 RepID=A0A1B0A320_GLOPL
MPQDLNIAKSTAHDNDSCGSLLVALISIILDSNLYEYQKFTKTSVNLKGFEYWLDPIYEVILSINQYLQLILVYLNCTDHQKFVPSSKTNPILPFRLNGYRMLLSKLKKYSHI